MNTFERDPITNAIYNGITKGIRVMIDNKCWGSAVILIWAGMDAMAYLSMPDKQVDVKMDDFVTWSEKYVHFPCREQLTGLDMYGARCGMLHNYSISSRLSREGKCRRLAYMDKGVPEIMTRSKASGEALLLVSIPALANGFFDGVNQFLIDIYKDRSRITVIEKRLGTLIHALPAK